MNHGISKDELVWVITRVIGAVFLWLAVLRIGGLLEIYFVTRGSGGHISQEMLTLAVRPNVFALIAYALLAFYFLRRGELFVGMISKMKHLHDDVRDTYEFEEWLAEDTANHAYPYKQQMAIFERWKMERY